MSAPTRQGGSLMTEILGGAVWVGHEGVGLLKLHRYSCSSEVKDTMDVGVFYSRDETRSLCARSYSSFTCVKSLLLWLGVKLLIYM